MAQVTIYKPAEVTVTVIDGEPPVDQSAEVAALQSQVAELQSQVASLQAKIDAAKSHIDAAKAELA